MFIISAFLILSTALIHGFSVQGWLRSGLPSKFYDCYLQRMKTALQSSPDQDLEDPAAGMDTLQVAMQKARACSRAGLSPGAGLGSADEQSDAAYADLILTSMTQRGIEELDEEDRKELTKGGTMWESGALSQENKIGIWGDMFNLWRAFWGGAHIVKNKFGET